jgi:hypothetical protein
VATKPFNAREITFQLERQLAKDFGTTAFAVLRNLIFASPVGDPENWQNPDAAPPGYVGGAFRRNWLVSIGGFNPSIIEGEDPTGASTLAEGRREIDKFQIRGKIGPGARLVIQNNLAYANRLANGWSLQAEAGWVDTAIDLALPEPGGRRDLP